MPIFKVNHDGFAPLERTSFTEAGIRERDHMQRFLREKIEIISPDTLVLCEEFGRWEDSRRRIDILGLDKNANLVVIELKRTEDGGHMELQALRYAGMVARMTFEKASETLQEYLQLNGSEEDATALLLDFLEWEEPDEDAFAQDVRIVLASAEFSKELTTSVLWLNEHGLDIRCVRMRPYRDGSEVFLDVQQLIPLPEAEEYQVRLREKSRLERISKSEGQDRTHFRLQFNEQVWTDLPKRWVIFHLVHALNKAGIDPDQIKEAVPWRSSMLRAVAGELNSTAFEKALAAQFIAEGKAPATKRFFLKDDQLLYANGKTYALTNQWGRKTHRAVESLQNAFNQFSIEVTAEE